MAKRARRKPHSRHQRRPKQRAAPRRKPVPAPPTSSLPALEWDSARFSRKTKRVTVEATLTPSDVRLLLTGSPAAMMSQEIAIILAGADSPLSVLAQGLKRGAEADPRTRRRLALARIKLVATEIYELLRRDEVPRDKAPLVAWARAALAQRVGDLDGFTPRDRTILLVAFLLSQSPHWTALGLKDPLAGGAATAVESFDKRYLKPGVVPRRFRFLPK
jgi:hypothetical protein